MRLVRFMDLAKAFGDEQAMGLADQLCLGIAEHFPGSGIDLQNDPGTVDDDDPFGERLQKGAHREIFLEKTGGESNLPLDSKFLFQAGLILVVGFEHRITPLFLAVCCISIPDLWLPPWS
jgi:hypothetical protein